MVDPMKPKQTFQQSEIQDGDIITFQRSYKEAESVFCNIVTHVVFRTNYILASLLPHFIPRLGSITTIF